MADITMCMNHECPIKETCYRYKAEPSAYQSYAMFVWKAGCKYYWDLNR